MNQASLHQSALTAFQAGDDQQAESLAHQALNGTPDDPELLQLLALTVGRLGRHAETLSYLERAIHLAPGHAQCHYNLAVTCQQAGFTDLAMLSYRDCLRLQPDHADALWNLGDLYRLDEQFPQAVACFETLIGMDRSYPDLYHRLAVSLHGMREDERALEYFDLALAGNSTQPALTRWEQSHALLTLGRFEAGWRGYDQRFEAGDVTGVRCHEFPYPRWRGEPLAGRTLLVHGEQGLGDEIMFGSILPELMDEAGRVVLACQPRLARLFAESMPALTVRAQNLGGPPAATEPLEPIDFQIPMGSLPAVRRNTKKSFGSRGRYLRADDARVDYFRRKLSTIAPAEIHKYKVGIMWGANPAHGVDWGMRRSRQKSIGLAPLLPLAALRDRVVFISLQIQELAGEAARAPELDVVDFHRDQLDMADTAALVENLDLVISVDTSVAHLAGAMGKPVWILLMARCDWRWMRGTRASPWYESARLFRQNRQGVWQPVVAKVKKELAAILES